MLPLSDGLPARSFPVVNVALIAANLSVWVFDELPDQGGAVAQASFYPCDVESTCAASVRALLDAGRIHPQSGPRSFVPILR